MSNPCTVSQISPSISHQNAFVCKFTYFTIHFENFTNCNLQCSSVWFPCQFFPRLFVSLVLHNIEKSPTNFTGTLLIHFSPASCMEAVAAAIGWNKWYNWCRTVMSWPSSNHSMLPLSYSLAPSFYPSATNLLTVGLHPSITGTRLAGTGSAAVCCCQHPDFVFGGKKKKKSSDKQEVLHFQFAKRRVQRANMTDVYWNDKTMIPSSRRGFLQWQTKKQQQWVLIKESGD